MLCFLLCPVCKRSDVLESLLVGGVVSKVGLQCFDSEPLGRGELVVLVLKQQPEEGQRSSRQRGRLAENLALVLVEGVPRCFLALLLGHEH
jgi:hypothetical protein